MVALLSESFTLPLTLRNWPWERRINPNYEVAKAQSLDWLESFHPFGPDKLTAFNKGNFALLCALTAPKATLYNLRNFCDLMNIFFVFDEYTDVMNPEQVRELSDLTLDVMRNPNLPRSKDENIIGEMTRQFWSRARVEMLPPTEKRFIREWEIFLDAQVEQAVRRGVSYICNPEEYVEDRRDNIGMGPLLVFIEVSLGLDLPEAAMNHPAVIALNQHTIDMITLGNDMCSYRKEVLANDTDYNIVTIVTRHKGIDASGAMQWISDFHDDLVEQFISLRDQVTQRRDFPSFGREEDGQLARYISGLGVLVRGHDEWLFASGRYFGTKGLQIQQTRKVYLHQ